MAALQALQSASIRLMGRKPSVFFSSTQKFELELCDLANEGLEDIAKSHDWQALKRVTTITGNSSTRDFPLPDDYDRMLVHSDVLDLRNWAWGYCNILDMNEFLYRQEHGFEPYPGGWIIYANRLHFSPAPATGAGATFPYISNQRVTSNDNVAKSELDRDDDKLFIPERLLTLWLVWRWREQKRMDSTGDQQNFEKAFNELAGRDKGSRILAEGPTRLPSGASVAYPWPLGQ